MDQVLSGMGDILSQAVKQFEDMDQHMQHVSNTVKVDMVRFGEVLKKAAKHELAQAIGLAILGAKINQFPSDFLEDSSKFARLQWEAEDATETLQTLERLYN